MRNKYFFTHHAIEKIAERMISVNKIIESLRNGAIIEEYPEDKYGPTSLIYGETKKARATACIGILQYPIVDYYSV